MKLYILAILFGLGLGLPPIFGLFRPARFRDGIRNFPRALLPGYVLMLLGTVWFLMNLQKETISDFAPYKPYMLLGFGLVGVLTCVFVRDFLAVRGLAIVLLLLAKLMVDTARWVDTEWRLVMVCLAYLMVLAGIWFTISPWRLRDLLQWATHTEGRVRVVCATLFCLGAFIAALGFTVYRTVELNKERRSAFLKTPEALSRPPHPQG